MFNLPIVRKHSRKTKNGTTSVRSHIRRKHQKRKLLDRIKDDRTTEPYVDEEKWLENPKKYDYPDIDDKLPENFKFVQEQTKGSKYFKEFTWYIDEKSNKKEMISEFQYPVHAVVLQHFTRSGEEVYLLSRMWTNTKYRKRGLSGYMLRELVKKADKDNMVVVLEAIPMDKKQESISSIDKLADYYSQFGFKQTRMYGKGHRKVIAMRRDPQK